MSTILLHVVWPYSANLECRSEMCCVQLAGNTGRKKIAIWAPSHNLLSSNIAPRCRRNMVNLGPLMAEIGSGVWGTPANFNGFRILAALLHDTQ